MFKRFIHSNALLDIKEFIGLDKEYWELDETILELANKSIESMKKELSSSIDIKLTSDSTWSDFGLSMFPTEALAWTIKTTVSDKIKPYLKDFKLSENEKWCCTARWMVALYNGYLDRELFLSKDPCAHCLSFRKCHTVNEAPSSYFKVIEEYSGKGSMDSIIC